MKTMKRGVLVWLTLSIVLFLLGCASLGTADNARIAQLRVKAEQGNSDAQIRLAAAYDKGQGVAKDPVEAAMWSRKAAEQGHAVAQNNLGSMYQHGEGVPQNDSEAVSWYQKAVDQGFGEAYTNLGYMYDSGLGVKQDGQRAVELYLNGAESGSLNAMLNLGVAYWKGKAVSKDLVRAYKWLVIAGFYTQNSPNMLLKSRIRGTLDNVRKEITSEQVSRAEQLIREWDEKHRSK